MQQEDNQLDSAPRTPGITVRTLSYNATRWLFTHGEAAFNLVLTEHDNGSTTLHVDGMEFKDRKLADRTSE